MTAKPKFTLDEIVKRRYELKKELKGQKTILKEDAKKLLAPFTSNRSTPSLFHNFNTGMFLLDGAIFGFKILHKIRNFFHRKR